MIRVVFVAIVLALATPAFAQDLGGVGRGEKVFAAQKCSMCHSVVGKGNKKGPLDDVGSRLAAEEIRRWIVNAPEMTAKTGAQRKPAMKVFGSLPASDIDDLVAYLQTLKKK